jgi:hypothetical protein
MQLVHRVLGVKKISGRVRVGVRDGDFNICKCIGKLPYRYLVPSSNAHL